MFVISDIAYGISIWPERGRMLVHTVHDPEHRAVEMSLRRFVK
ncbi:MAG TPA: hypothetical protein VMC42_10310 [Methanoregulaceae archaeon]|nr:hypothetical protein [Methanoregulaceae archaeon]